MSNVTQKPSPPSDTNTPAADATGEVATSSKWNDGWTCVPECGNEESFGGFSFVSIAQVGGTTVRVEVEPSEAEWPRPLYVCNLCGRVIDQDTLRPNPHATDEYDSHIVDVVAGPGPVQHKNQ